MIGAPNAAGEHLGHVPEDQVGQRLAMPVDQVSAVAQVTDHNVRLDRSAAAQLPFPLARVHQRRWREQPRHGVGVEPVTGGLGEPVELGPRRHALPFVGQQPRCDQQDGQNLLGRSGLVVTRGKKNAHHTAVGNVERRRGPGDGVHLGEGLGIDQVRAVGLHGER